MNVEFEEWKGRTEDGICSYVKITGGKENVQYYQCNRGGLYKPNSTEKRRMKSQGTVVTIFIVCNCVENNTKR
jgi:hypothetical protein